jgi:hypothetical protein
MSFVDIVTNGKYYNPANCRYAPNSVVVCDRCKTRDLIACIGYLDQDLCLPCADQVIVIVERTKNKIQPITQMNSTRYDPIITKMNSTRYDPLITRMGSNRFAPPVTLMRSSRFDSNITYMMSDRFREPVDYYKVTGLT